MIVVPDASVLLKWVLQKEKEPDQRQAMALQQAFLNETVEVRLPTLWRYEVGNVLGLKSPALAIDLMSTLLAYEFEEVPLRSEYALAVLEHMQHLERVTFYDSAYHVLAIRTKGTYLTADDAYVSRAKQRGHIELLRNWEE